MLSACWTASVAADWNSCADDFDFRRSSRGAADIDQQGKSKASDLESFANDPRTFDLMRDNCRGLASDYESEVSRLQSELDTTKRRLRDAGSSWDGETDEASVERRQ
jgi:hypothetical protein